MPHNLANMQEVPQLVADETEAVDHDVPELVADDFPSVGEPWMDVKLEEPRAVRVRPLSGPALNIDTPSEPVRNTPAREIEVRREEKGLLAIDEESAGVSSDVLKRLKGDDPSRRAAALAELGQMGGDDSFHLINKSFDDPSPEVRNAAARALYDVHPDRAASFTRALREGSPERRRKIGAQLRLRRHQPNCAGIESA